MEGIYQSTFVLLKPNAIQREMVGRIIERFEDKGLRIDALKMMHVNRKLAEAHYAEHEGKPYYTGLIKFITSGPVVVMVLSGPNAIGAVRYVVGSTNPLEAQPGTIRGEYAITTAKNLVHASDSVEAAKVEISRFFEPHEIIDYHLNLEEDM